ncbi:MAG: signal peptidase I [Thermomicrobiales bacterium]|nr:signal peptidase I [Thermomicrobiales bacterium]
MTESTPPTLPTEIASTPAEIPVTKPKKKTGALREIIETALLALIIFVLVRNIVLNFRVDGSSMLPTLQNNEMILVNRNAYRELDLGDFVDWLPGVPEQHWVQIVDWGQPERGDVIVFTPPPPGEDKPYIKRVIGLPGDHVQITADGQVLVNGVALDEPYIGDYTNDCVNVPSFNYCDVIVPEGSYFVMGDHRNNSSDSRYFGVVTEDRIIGKAWIVYWPTGEFGPVEHPDYDELGE